MTEYDVCLPQRGRHPPHPQAHPGTGRRRQPAGPPRGHVPGGAALPGRQAGPDQRHPSGHPHLGAGHPEGAPDPGGGHQRHAGPH